MAVTPAPYPGGMEISDQSIVEDTTLEQAIETVMLANPTRTRL